MSNSDMTLILEMTVEWCSFAIGAIASFSDPSMRYFTPTSVSRVSI